MHIVQAIGINYTFLFKPLEQLLINNSVWYIKLILPKKKKLKLLIN